MAFVKFKTMEHSISNTSSKIPSIQDQPSNMDSVKHLKFSYRI